MKDRLSAICSYRIRRVGPYVLLAATLLGVSSCSSLRSSPDKASNKAGLLAAIQTQLPSLSGRQISLAEFKGKIVLLHFMASWCRQCAAEATSLNSLRASFQGSPFAIVGVATDDDPFQFQVFASRHNLQFPVLLDSTGDLKSFFGVRSIPTTIFLDKDGVPLRFADPSTGEVTAKMEGARQWDSPSPVAMIASLVERK